MSIKLKEPIINGGLPRTNFFNGRLVTGADMTREQTARRKAVSRLGKALGDGIVYGLEVTTGGANSIVNVTKGLAVNRCGQALYLSDDTSVDLVQRFGTVDQASTLFTGCEPLSSGTYASGSGYYLLVLSPAETTQGSAPTSGLNNAFANCNKDVILETARFNLLPVDLKNDDLPDDKRGMRNYIAYRCFGYQGSSVPKLPEFFKDPFGFSLASYGLIDEMRNKSLSDGDVPLAIIHWTTERLEFVEMWAVRRRVTRRDDDEEWTQVVKDRRVSEAEAMIMHFADRIESLRGEVRNLKAVEADDYFQYLPPAGILPVSLQGSVFNGFDVEKFFGGRVPKKIVSIDGDRLRVLFRESLSHEPIDLTSSEKIQLYFVRENLQAVKDGERIQPAVVFARHSLPYLGVARFDEAEYDIDQYSV